MLFGRYLPFLESVLIDQVNKASVKVVERPGWKMKKKLSLQSVHKTFKLTLINIVPKKT